MLTCCHTMKVLLLLLIGLSVVSGSDTEMSNTVESPKSPKGVGSPRVKNCKKKCSNRVKKRKCRKRCTRQVRNMKPTTRNMPKPTRPKGTRKPFADIEFYFEENTTDEDLGVHLKLGADPWTDLTIKSPEGSTMLHVKTDNVLKVQGLSDFSFESAEPNYEEVSRDAILARFPKGKYAFEARALDGGKFFNRVFLSHEIPSGPIITSPKVGTVPHGDVVIEWEGVTGIQIRTYEVIVTNEDDNRFKSDAYYGPNARKATVPKDFFKPGSTYELEVIARANNFNQAISIIFFDVAVGN